MDARPRARRAARRGTTRSPQRASGRPAGAAGRRARRRIATGDAGLDDVAGQPRGRGDPRVADGGLAPSPAAAPATSSSPSSSRIDRGVGVEQGRRLLDDLVEQHAGIELRREQGARAGQLLGEGTSAPLGLEQLAALERAAGCPGEIARELEVVVGEAPLVAGRRRARARVSSVRGTSTGTASSAREPESAVTLRHSSSKRSSSTRRGAASTRPPRAAARSGPDGSPRPSSRNLISRPGSPCRPASRSRRRAASAPRRSRRRAPRLAACATASRVSSREIGSPSTAAMR